MTIANTRANTTTSMTTRGSLDALLAGQPRLAASPHAALNTLRADAVDRVAVLTVPTARDEDWRFTDISPLMRMSLHPAREPGATTRADVEAFALPEAGCRLVFVDGIYVPALSQRWSSEAPAGHGADDLVVGNLASLSAADAVRAETYLGRQAGYREHLFTALNTAFLQDAAIVIVPRGLTLRQPLHLLFIATQAQTASHPRCLVIAEAGSAVTLIEDYVSLQDGGYFTNAVAEVALAPAAQVTHLRVQREGSAAIHVAAAAVSLGRGSAYRSVSVALGAAISRYELAVVHNAEGAHCSIDGLTLIGGRQLADTHSAIDHAHAQGESRQRHKCIVDGQAHAVFNGKILVRQDAQRTDSSQSSRNLLLSSRARVDTKPQLEIFADDVKCAHGATVGQLDAEVLFYLTSRGLSAAAAKSLLTYAFGAEILERIPVASLRQRLESQVLRQTAGTHRSSS